ncbi:MAG: hypothetical protein CVU85_08710 [Firmicutes bacterium HGW-Firmicutes-10]|nr:MAG: hypothetical protein CVU85_08710 [Firmicutes bacterium HGW-Firmicutes-10]
MEQKKDIALRSELRLEDTWNLTPIYADDAAWESDFTEVDGKAPKAAGFQGRLGESAQVLLDAIKFQEDVFYKVGLLYVYAHLNFDTDTTNAHYQAMFSRIESLYAKVSAAFSFYRSELMEIEEAKIWGFVDQKGSWIVNPQYEKINNFDNQMARVRKAGEWGWIDPSGKYIINPQFANAMDFVKVSK